MEDPDHFLGTPLIPLNIKCDLLPHHMLGDLLTRGGIGIPVMIRATMATGDHYTPLQFGLNLVEQIE